MKTCNRCDVEQPSSSFHKHSSTRDGLRNQCVSCRNIEKTSWRKSTPLLQKAQNKRDMVSVNKTDYRQEYRKKNKERINEQNRVSYTRGGLERQRMWQRDNRGLVRSYCASRRSSLIKAKPSWANDLYLKLWYKLAKIEEERTGCSVHVDHIVPLKGKNVCGLHCEDNLQLLFAEDNLKKTNKFNNYEVA